MPKKKKKFFNSKLNCRFAIGNDAKVTFKILVMFLDNTQDLVILDYFVTTNQHYAKFYSLLLQYRDKDDNLCTGIFAEEMPTVEWQRWFNKTTERFSRNESVKFKVFFDTPKHYYSGFVREIIEYLEKEGKLIDRSGQPIIW